MEHTQKEDSPRSRFSEGRHSLLRHHDAAAGRRPASATAIDSLIAPFKNSNIDLVVGMESRGFIFGSVVADRLGAGFVPVRKVGQAAVEDAARDLRPRVRHRLARDSRRCGGGGAARADRRRSAGDRRARRKRRSISSRDRAASSSALAFLIELIGLDGRSRLAGENVHAVLKYECDLGRAARHSGDRWCRADRGSMARTRERRARAAVRSPRCSRRRWRRCMPIPGHFSHGSRWRRHCASGFRTNSPRSTPRRGSTFPFSKDVIAAAHARWTAEWLAWEKPHDGTYKLKALVAQQELTAAASTGRWRARSSTPSSARSWSLSAAVRGIRPRVEGVTAIELGANELQERRPLRPRARSEDAFDGDVPLDARLERADVPKHVVPIARLKAVVEPAGIGPAVVAPVIDEDLSTRRHGMARV